MRRTGLAGMLTVYSVSHFIVDLSCIFLVVSLMMPDLSSRGEWLLCVALYNIFAFAFQMPVGALADITGRNAVYSAAGCAVVLLAYGVNLLPSCLIVHILTAVTAGIGNSCFHIGGGIDVLNAGRGRAALPGIYVSTGAFGIYLGGRIYKGGMNEMALLRFIIPAMLIAAALVIVLMYIKNGAKDWERIESKAGNAVDIPKKPSQAQTDGSESMPQFSENPISRILIIAASCLVFTVCVRSYAGTVVSYEWQSSFVLSLLFISGVILGKALGGVIGDHLGWTLTGTASLFLSAFCFIGGRFVPALGILAIFLFNMTMPLTLTALANLLPSHTGMSFGMTTFALFIGVVPSILGDDGRMFAPLPMTLMVFVSAAVLYAGLRAYEREMKEKQDREKSAEAKL